MEVFDTHFDKMREQCIEFDQLSVYCRWLGHNPRGQQLDDWRAKYDPNRTKSISRLNCLKCIDELYANPDTYEELLEAML